MSGLLGRRQERRVVSSRRRRLSLTRVSFPLGCLRPVRILLEAEVETCFSAREFLFAKKWDHFLGGMPPVVAPEGNLGFKRLGNPS
jgi:hypothetical protein